MTRGSATIGSPSAPDAAQSIMPQPGGRRPSDLRGSPVTRRAGLTLVVVLVAACGGGRADETKSTQGWTTPAGAATSRSGASPSPVAPPRINVHLSERPYQMVARLLDQRGRAQAAANAANEAAVQSVTLTR